MNLTKLLEKLEYDFTHGQLTRAQALRKAQRLQKQAQEGFDTAPNSDIIAESALLQAMRLVARIERRSE